MIWAPNSATATRNLPIQQAGAGAGVYNATRQVGAVLGSAAIAVFMDARLAAQGLQLRPRARATRHRQAPRPGARRRSATRCSRRCCSPPRSCSSAWSPRSSSSGRATRATPAPCPLVQPLRPTPDPHQQRQQAEHQHRSPHERTAERERRGRGQRTRPGRGCGGSASGRRGVRAVACVAATLRRRRGRADGDGEQRGPVGRLGDRRRGRRRATAGVVAAVSGGSGTVSVGVGVAVGVGLGVGVGVSVGGGGSVLDPVGDREAEASPLRDDHAPRARPPERPRRGTARVAVELLGRRCRWRRPGSGRTAAAGGRRRAAATCCRQESRRRRPGHSRSWPSKNRSRSTTLSGSTRSTLEASAWSGAPGRRRSPAAGRAGTGRRATRPSRCAPGRRPTRIRPLVPAPGERGGARCGRDQQRAGQLGEAADVAPWSRYGTFHSRWVARAAK